MIGRSESMDNLDSVCLSVHCITIFIPSGYPDLEGHYHKRALFHLTY